MMNSLLSMKEASVFIFSCSILSFIILFSSLVFVVVYDMQSLGLSPEDLNPSGPLSSRRALARAQSAQIMSKKFIQRDRIKRQMKEEEVGFNNLSLFPLFLVLFLSL